MNNSIRVNNNNNIRVNNNNSGSLKDSHIYSK
jgi:hypothetical protein